MRVNNCALRPRYFASAAPAGIKKSRPISQSSHSGMQWPSNLLVNVRTDFECLQTTWSSNFALYSSDTYRRCFKLGLDGEDYKRMKAHLDRGFDINAVFMALATPNGQKTSEQKTLLGHFYDFHTLVSMWNQDSGNIRTWQRYAADFFYGRPMSDERFKVFAPDEFPSVYVSTSYTTSDASEGAPSRILNHTIMDLINASDGHVRLCDVGCGYDASLGRMLAESHPNLRYSGVDPMLECEGVGLTKGMFDDNYTPRNGEPVEIIVAAESMTKYALTVDELETFFRNASRIHAPGGSLVLSGLGVSLLTLRSGGHDYFVPNPADVISEVAERFGYRISSSMQFQNPSTGILVFVKRGD